MYVYIYLNYIDWMTKKRPGDRVRLRGSQAIKHGHQVLGNGWMSVRWESLLQRGKACRWKNTGGLFSPAKECWLKVRNWVSWCQAVALLAAASEDISQWDRRDRLLGMRGAMLLKSLGILCTCIWIAGRAPWTLPCWQESLTGIWLCSKARTPVTPHVWLTFWRNF